jgi:octaheme c-type cytochrome (tetrathionate reductase family)
VAQQVGPPDRVNCGTCHFFGGGGNNVKHGDLEQALFDAPRTVDVHMGTYGMDMSCTDCHTADQHQMLGKAYSVSSMNRDRVECAQCHSDVPHDDDVLNSHTLKVACQTCHIPTYAKVNPTKMSWDWSTAGQLKDGKPFHVTDSTGMDTYASIKGTFTWSSNVKPEYIWFNGTASHYLMGDTIDPSKPVAMNTLYGGYDDPDSKITPVKVHKATQIYDTQHRYLIQPKTYSSAPGDSGFWREFNWSKAAAAGMKEVGLPFSGSYGFVPTEMTWPVNHMVAPASETVSCEECHTPNNGRLANLQGFYLPGRDSSPWVESIGGAVVIATLLGVGIHGGLRYVTYRRRMKRGSHA